MLHTVNNEWWVFVFSVARVDDDYPQSEESVLSLQYLFYLFIWPAGSKKERVIRIIWIGICKTITFIIKANFAHIPPLTCFTFPRLVYVLVIYQSKDPSSPHNSNHCFLATGSHTRLICVPAFVANANDPLSGTETFLRICVPGLSMPQWNCSVAFQWSRLPQCKSNLFSQHGGDIPHVCVSAQMCQHLSLVCVCVWDSVFSGISFGQWHVIREWNAQCSNNW